MVYSDYLKKHNWKIVNSVSEGLVRSLTAKNKAGDLFGIQMKAQTGSHTLVTADYVKAK